MLEAAYRLFCSEGYASTTMTAIADEAEVAVQTLYFTFHTKGALLGEVLGAAIAGFDRWNGPPRGQIDAADPKTLAEFHLWFEPFEKEPDARRALSMFVSGSSAAMQRGARLVAAMHAALGDPEARGVFELGERRRAETFGTLIRILAKKKGGLRTGLRPARATDILLTMFSPYTFQSLEDRGWSLAECKHWLVELLEQQLLPTLTR